MRDELCNKMIQVINDIETFMGNKKKTRRGKGKARDQKKNLEKREKMIKKLDLCGIGTKLCPGCSLKSQQGSTSSGWEMSDRKFGI